MNDSLYTPKSLWQDFDADLPLECVTTRQFEDSGAEVTEMYFSGRASEFGRPRIFGTLWRSRADSPEVIVVIGDRTGGISSETYRPLSERYNLFFFDYAGETGETPKHLLSESARLCQRPRRGRGFHPRSGHRAGDPCL